MNVPNELYYTPTHEWLRKEGEFLVVGITDFAQHELTDVVFVELPEPGRVVAKGDPCCVVESTKVAADVYAPIDGEIIAVNDGLGDHPEWLNQSPYETGWLFRILPTKTVQIDALLNPKSYREILGGE